MYITVHEPEGKIKIQSEEAFDAYKKDKLIVEAAGGMVLNENRELLMMFRRGLWDMPKGKLDKGETLEECALREVSEETGLTGLTLVNKLQTTYHTYIYKGKLTLKPSHWYLMTYRGNGKFIPQTEEYITEVVWADKKRAKVLAQNAYPSIREMLEKYYLNQP